MKKRLMIIFWISVLFLMGSCQEKAEKGSVKQLSTQDIVQMIENDQTFVFYIGQTTCSSCKEFSPIAQQLAKNKGVTVYYLEMDTEDETEFDAFKEKYVPELLYTPTAFIVIDGEITEYRVVSKTNYRKLKEWLAKAGIIND